MSDYKITVGETSIDVANVIQGVAIYNLTCNVVRMTKTNTALGLTEVPVVIVNSMLCAITWLSGKEAIKFNKETHTLDGILRCRVPAGVTIVTSDKIVYGGITYEITNVRDKNNLGVLLEIGIKRIK